MTIYHTYLSDSTESGLETIQGIQNDGSEFGVGISSDIVCNNISAGIITATQINGNIIGVSTLSVGYASTAGIATYATSSGIATYASTAGIATYADTAGISTTSQGLTGTPNITVGVITASAYVATGTTAVYAGGVGISTVDSDTTASHYVTYDTNSTAVNISNFSSGKTFNVVARNTGGGNRTLIIRTSTTNSGHAAVPTIVHLGGTLTNGTITIASGAGLLISVFNMNGTVIGGY